MFKFANKEWHENCLNKRNINSGQDKPLQKLPAKFGFNPLQDGGAKKPPTSFSTVTSTNVRISPQNFLNFIFNPFDWLV